jgi:hypothetical protein
MLIEGTSSQQAFRDQDRRNDETFFKINLPESINCLSFRCDTPIKHMSLRSFIFFVRHAWIS